MVPGVPLALPGGGSNDRDLGTISLPDRLPVPLDDAPDLLFGQPWIRFAASH